MRRILLCDDNHDELIEIETLIRRYYTEKQRDFQAYAFLDQREALCCCAENKPDAAILDIVMPGMSGVALAEAMRAQGFQGVLAFLTTVNDFASESYEVGARAYLRKPVNCEKLYKLLDSLDMMDSGQSFVTVTRRGSTQLLPVNELVYVEVMRNTLYFHMRSGDVVNVNAALKEYIGTLLSFENMAQCHVSFVVNMNFIHTLERNSVTLKGGVVLPVARSQQGFRDKCLNWLFGKGEEPIGNDV